MLSITPLCLPWWVVVVRRVGHGLVTPAYLRGRAFRHRGDAGPLVVHTVVKRVNGSILRERSWVSYCVNKNICYMYLNCKLSFKQVVGMIIHDMNFNFTLFMRDHTISLEFWEEKKIFKLWKIQKKILKYLSIENKENLHMTCNYV